MPEGVRAAHERLLGAHLDRLAATSLAVAEVSMAARLDHLERRLATPAPTNGIGL